MEEDLVARASGRVAQAGLQHQVEIKLYTPGPLPVASASMDVVFGKDSWAHVENKSDFFSEVFRVPKPGGVLAAGDWMRRSPTRPARLEGIVRPPS